MKTTICLTLTLLTFVTLAFVPNASAQDNSPESVVRLYYVVPSDQEPLSNIDAIINEEIKNGQLAFAELLENHGFDRKTFTYETDAAGNAVVHHINGVVSHANFYDKFPEVIEKIYGRYSPFVDEMRAIIDEQPNTISLIMFDYDEGLRICGEASRYPKVAFVRLKDGCFNHHVIAHELAHVFGLKHHDIDDDVLIPNPHTSERMLMSLCSAEWLNVSRYLNSELKNSTGPTTTRMLPPLGLSPISVRLRFDVADPDGLYMAQLVVAAPGGGDTIAYKRLDGEKVIIEFETTKIGSLLEFNQVTLLVIDETGDISDFHAGTFPIDITLALPSPEAISIPDANLASAIRNALELAPDSTITQLDMLKLRHIYWKDPGRQITDLTNLEHAIHLRSLSLYDNQIQDITPLSKLTKLENLRLTDSQIQDITPLSKLTKLETLRLLGNQIQDITPLSKLADLRELMLSNNQIHDLTPLIGLTQLSQLLLDNNLISDITPLADLTNLASLSLNNNQINDISPLADLVSLTRLQLVGNPIKDRKPLLELLKKNPNVKIYLKSGDEPLPVNLSHFRAEHFDAGVILKWTTESEVDNAGFYIYRSQTRDGEFKVVNSTMIQGAGTTGERNEYTWTDTSAKPNTVYYYQIEDVSHAGVREQLATVRIRGLVSAHGKLTTRWAALKAEH